MPSGIVDTSRGFFEEIVHPLMERHFPEAATQMACGVFGYGSEVLFFDDELSRDHHWGLRVDILLPDAMHRELSGAILGTLVPELPQEYGGIPLRDAHVSGHGIAPESLQAFLRRVAQPFLHRQPVAARLGNLLAVLIEEQLVGEALRRRAA